MNVFMHGHLTSGQMENLKTYCLWPQLLKGHTKEMGKVNKH